MTYYMQRGLRGDYYRGDYYMGDPGFFSFLGGIGKSILGSVTGMQFGAGPPSGQPIPTLGGALSKLVAKVPALTQALAPPAGILMTRPTSSNPIMTSSKLNITRYMPGAGQTYAKPGTGLVNEKGRTVARMGPNGPIYFRRRMNVTNVKALRRSIRRCQGFAKLAKKVLRFTSPKPPRGRPIFKRRARKK